MAKQKGGGKRCSADMVRIDAPDSITWLDPKGMEILGRLLVEKFEEEMTRVRDGKRC